MSSLSLTISLSICFFSSQSLKESAEEIDNGTQYHLARYAFLFESTILGDGMAVTPVGAPESGELRRTDEKEDEA